MTAGVYVIWCRPRKRGYVGQSANVSKRFGVHRFQLRHGHHSIRELQQDWDYYGEESFQFRLIEAESNKAVRLQLESEWIDRLQAVTLGYNTAHYSTNGGTLHTGRTKQLMSEAARQRNANPAYNKMLSDRCKKQHKDGTLNITPESRKKTADANRGRSMSEEQKEKLRASALSRREQMQEAARKSVIARGLTLKQK